MIGIWIATFVLLAIAGVHKAISDALMSTLKADFSKSFFADLGDEQFWNPAISHQNKWKNGDKRQGEKFWGSSTFFVFRTDGWHLCNSITYWCFFAALALHLPKFYFESEVIDYVFRLVITKSFFTGVFQFFFTAIKK